MFQPGFCIGSHQAVDIHLHDRGQGFGNFHGKAFFLYFAENPEDLPIKIWGKIPVFDIFSRVFML